MALIKCSECGKEISDKSKKCIYCGAKFRKSHINKKRITKSIFTIMSIILLIIVCIFCILLLGNLKIIGLYLSSCGTPMSEYTLFNIIIFISILLQILILFKNCKIKSHIIIKMFSIVSILIGTISMTIYFTNYLEAYKYDFDVSIKTIVEKGNYSIEAAKIISSKIDEVIYPYSCYSIPIEDIYTEGNNEQIFIFNDTYEEINFSLTLEISNEKIKNMYWNFKNEAKIYLYKNYEKTDNVYYYAKVLQYTSGSENCISCTYLKTQIEDSVRDKLNLSLTDIITFNSLNYDNNIDSFYYNIGINNENNIIKAYLKNKDNHELDYYIIEE